MNVITLRDYAKQNHISYEAVRQQVNRYASELGEHIIRDGRQQFLDEEAVAFLDAKRQKNPIAIIQQDKDEQIEELKSKIEQLLTLNAAQANRIAELAQWKADNAVAIADANHRQQLLEERQEKIAHLTSQNADLSADNAEKDKKIEEAEKTAEEANLRLTEAHESFEAELEKKNKRIQELENRNLWHYLTAPFRKTTVQDIGQHKDKE